MSVEKGVILLRPVPVELYPNARIDEFLESSEMTETELAEARDAWDL